MADPLSIASGVAGLLSLGLQTTNTLVEFYASYRDQDDNIARTSQRLETLQDVFQALQAALQQRKFQPDERTLISRSESSLQSCAELISELQQECAKLTGTSHGSFKDTIRVAGRRIAYPFRESTLKKLEEDAGEIRDHLSLALDILQLRDHKTAQDELAEIKSLVERVRATQISSEIQNWFKAPDALINHNAASAKRHPGTGLWFVKGPIFQNWVNQTNSFLWLYGFAGCGKSVLCSTAIQHAFRQRRDAHIGVAFFYFTFDDEAKQDQSAMLRALLLQLASQLPDGHSRLQRLHESYRTGPPPAVVLREQLRECIQRFNQVYILIDALDESPRGNRRDDVMNTVVTVRDWSIAGLHLLVTSRDELDIRESLDARPDEKVAMKNTDIDRDIKNFIIAKLSTDSKFRAKWQLYQDQIQEALAERAQGVFRWVECQFEALKRCPRSKHHLERCLQSLPRNLDETYERMLLSIDKESYEEARRTLTLLCFSSRPLKVSEVLHGIAIDLGEHACLNRDRVLDGIDDLREICPGLIDFGLDAEEAAKSTTDSMSSEMTVRIAHFSVQEYLESERICQQKAAFFSMSSISAHQQIATICCAYLLEPQLSNGQLTRAKLIEFPFAYFAAQFWYHHYQEGKENSAQVEKLMTKMFTQSHDHFATLIKLHDLVDIPWEVGVDFQRASSTIAPALYYASFLGLQKIIHEILYVRNADIRKVEDKVNAQGGEYGNALQAASARGHIEIVKILMEKGADVYAQGGMYDNALSAASYRGHIEIVKMLIEKGADIHAHGQRFGNALSAASYGGHIEIVKILIEKGADIHAQGGIYDGALSAASYGGHTEIVKMLIEKGADIHAQGEMYANALSAASTGGYVEIVKMLLEKGADIHAQGGIHGNALSAASAQGHIQIVKMLVEKGADIHAQGGIYGNALQAASIGGQIEIVKMLVEKGADIHAQSGYFGNALSAASCGGHIEIVKMLVEKGADIHAQGGEYGNALSAASCRGHIEIVKTLIEMGADIHAQGREYGNALSAALAKDHIEIVEFLIANGAVPYEEG